MCVRACVRMCIVYVVCVVYVGSVRGVRGVRRACK